jgi:hypothetical protein
MFIPQSIKRTAFPALLVERLRGALVSIPQPPDEFSRRQPKLSARRSVPEMSQGYLRRMAGRLKARGWPRRSGKRFSAFVATIRNIDLHYLLNQ